MRTALPESIRSLMACPLCKVPLTWQGDASLCRECACRFAPNEAGVWKFTVEPPEFLPLQDHQKWKWGQDLYEEYSRNLATSDNYETYLAEIEGVREIYTEVFRLSGFIADVGGERGRLRHFLSDCSRYLNLDPFEYVFRNLDEQPNLLKAYPCLNEPCNFAVAQAERLPLRAGVCDYVHMRSVLDHFRDPFLAVCEAHRVLKPGGGLMIGVAIHGWRNGVREDPPAPPKLGTRVKQKLAQTGVVGTAKAAALRAVGLGPAQKVDSHIWHPALPELMTLLEKTHFTIEKTHWQKPPHDFCIYLMARKPI